MNKIKQFLHGIGQSHRGLHILCGLLVGLFFGSGAALVAGGALEFKDCQHDRYNAGRRVRDWRWKAWDWVDFFCTVAGGLLGSVLRWWVIGRFM